VKLEVAPYDPAWAARFETERNRLAQALGDRAKRIEHIGSTAVPGLAAKPVVDIEIDLDDFADPSVHDALRSAGFNLAVDEAGHRMYRTPEMHVHVHVWESVADFERHIQFRDWLRTHPEDVALYEHVKRKLAEREWRDRDEYADAKDGVIHAIMRRANGQQRGPRIGAFAEAISQHVTARARVLEIGAGEGELAEKLSAAGYDVVALDQTLRSRFPIVETSFERYNAPPESFDCIVAQLVLHHVDDLGATLKKAKALLRAGGVLAVDDYGWERSGDAAFRADRSDLLTSEVMLDALRSHFHQIAYFDHAYFEEGAGTDRLGFTFIGRRFH
jgi:GrpB-like predicted nucleotidyltransferase (UPF0157 family)